MSACASGHECQYEAALASGVSFPGTLEFAATASPRCAFALGIDTTETLSVPYGTGWAKYVTWTQAITSATSAGHGLNTRSPPLLLGL